MMLIKSHNNVLLIVLVELFLMWTLCYAQESRRCRGRKGESSAGGSDGLQLASLRLDVNNGDCTIVELNLVIRDIASNSTTLDLSFLENITEIKGFLFISETHKLTRFPLPNLRVVRGEATKYENPPETRGGQFAIILSDLPNIVEWPFPNLEEVTNGDVLLHTMPALKYGSSIDWEDIQNGRRDGVVSYDVGTGRTGNDTNCNSSCDGGYCWTATKCQTRSLKICSHVCPHRCLGPGLFQCCHGECTGSCRAVDDDRQCSACSTYENGDVCEDQCPSLTVYDRSTGGFVINPNGRYIYQDQCLASCPAGFLSDGQKCASRCPDGQEPDRHDVCVPCKGACPKICDAPPNGVINSSNVADFINCTDIAGNVVLNSMLSGDPSKNISMVTEDDLEVFSQVRSISGHLLVFSTHKGIKSLKFFRNLEIIRGTEKYFGYSLYVQTNKGLTDLGFSSLRTILDGNIYAVQNSKLCVAMTTAGLLDAKVLSPGFSLVNVLNAQCGVSPCHSQCNTTLGCWGQLDADACVRCVSFDYEGRCVSNCTAATTGNNLIYHDYASQKCLPCHDECAGGCDGPGQDECHSCRNVRDRDFCYSECPPQKYNDSSDVCQDCNLACEVGGSCTGPGDNKGPGGCDDCDLFFVDANETNVIHCVNDGDGCPEFYYRHVVSDGNHPFFRLHICRRCHESCRTCLAAGEECQSCRSDLVYSAGLCVAECPSTKYEALDQTCQDCPNHCGVSGCIFNQTTHRPECKLCQHLLEDIDGVDHCVEQCTDMKPFQYDVAHRCYAECPRTTYKPEGLMTCLECSEQCRIPDADELDKRMCKDGKDHEQSCLLGCRNVEHREVCVDECDSPLVAVEYRIINGTEVEIEDPTTEPPGEGTDEEPVNSRAEGRGDEGGDNEDDEEYEIRRRCQIKKLDPGDEGNVENQKSSENLLPVIIGAATGLTVVIAGIGVALFFWFRWAGNRKVDYDEEDMAAVDNPMYGGAAEVGMLDMKSAPAAVAPTDARLVLVPESSLETLEILGTGAFGTVYKGKWLPEGETEKLLVAIKVLNEGTGKAASKELLQEAVVMASMDHPHLVRLLCVCMASRVMLVTQLVPLGSLLSYLRKRKKTLTGEALMVFSQQIAKGMVYLEEKRLVHRDLAARNVLVQTPMMVKISDFGLSKMLDVGEGHFQSVGEKMPIKWLAPESLSQLKFTHKSDVWAFGVTVWEVMTFGNQPFKGKKGNEMYTLLISGERLPHPKICTHEVYALMLQCWMIDPDSRPTFKSLARQLAVMCRDTSKFVTTEADQERAEGRAKIRTGTYETATLLSEWSDADDDGYDNAAGVTFNPYENPLDCIPESAYANTVELDSIDEDDGGAQYDNTVMPNGHSASKESTNDYDNPLEVSHSRERLLPSPETTENPYDNMSGEATDLSSPDAAYDNLNIDTPREDHEIQYDNPVAAGEGEGEVDKEQTDDSSHIPGILDGGEDVDDDMMDPGAGYQDPASVGVDT